MHATGNAQSLETETILLLLEASLFLSQVFGRVLLRTFGQGTRSGYLPASEKWGLELGRLRARDQRGRHCARL